MGWKTGILGLVAALLLSGGDARGQDVLYRNKALTCVATAPTVLKMWVDDLSYGLGGDHAWGKVRVHLLLRNHTERRYLVGGKANLTMKKIPPNRAAASFSYAGVACTVRHHSITSVQNCRGDAHSRTCDVSLRYSGTDHVYAVSLTVEPAR